MATAENLDREKHHFNPAENHYYPFNNRGTIQRDYQGSEFATPPYSSPDSSFHGVRAGTALSQALWNHFAYYVYLETP